MARTARLAVGPDAYREWFAPAVTAGGGEVVDLDRAEALLWAAPGDPEGLRSALTDHGGHLEWVQLPWAGIEPYLDVLGTGEAAAERIWTCGKGVYAEPVAELALTLALAGMRGLDRYARARRWRADGELGENLRGAAVTVLGGGGITEVLLRLLAPWGCDVTVARRHPDPVPGARRVLGSSPAEIDEAVAGADLVVLALALTPETTGILDARRLAMLHDRSVVVNVARGPHIVTDDLVDALRAGRILAAGLDVTDPEPLPESHALWSLPNCIVTPHVGNTTRMAIPLLATRVTANVARWVAGEELLGRVERSLGY
jgi:phosphoglycerate dehydrogenase-like enzyme